MKLYVVTRDLHLYAGLFISPFVLVFAVSVFCIVHGWLPTSLTSTVRSVSGLQIPAGLLALKGKEQINQLRPVLDQMNVQGEINFVRRVAREDRLIVPVNVPGRETEVNLDVASHSAVVTQRATGVLSAVVFLHKMPGPHNVALRGNSLYMQIWRWFADTTAYATLFITATGIYLWTALKAERRIGLALIAAGTVTFFGVVLAVIL